MLYTMVENLLKQQFKAYEPNAVWVSDITYVPTDEGGYTWLGTKTFLPVRSWVMPWERG
jgi:transposase InsO family protein